MNIHPHKRFLNFPEGNGDDEEEGMGNTRHKGRESDKEVIEKVAPTPVFIHYC